MSRTTTDQCSHEKETLHPIFDQNTKIHSGSPPNRSRALPLVGGVWGVSGATKNQYSKDHKR